MEQEGQWVQAALEGDQHAFGRLVDAYKGPVYNICFRMLGNQADAEDAAQETFVRIYTRLRSYDPQQRLSSWILAVASHYCIDRLRRQRIKWFSLDDLLPVQELQDEADQPETVLLQSERTSEVQSLLQSLPPEYRLVIALRYWQDLSYEEIAKTVGATESAVKSRLHRAREMLAQQAMARRLPVVRQDSARCNGERVITNVVL
ncbi:MAG TPA: sigma-70 family RNA polymerase sigma factor [Anaerolineae bacterium]|mgnify:CR=1 FL=1|nr:sigma-70 family RNA polymerase sigma factor [Anaerolineae bacterium]HNT05430.1 sigma-70 family RNA polymerase sigma factor [Anaerolineae bacterium]HQJ50325.1 sigma-70 family RNA polymerase sigma factor [Anaerolineae bacterium]